MTAALVILFIIIACLISGIVAMDKNRYETLATLRMVRRNNVQHELLIQSLDKKLYMAGMRIKFLTLALDQK